MEILVTTVHIATALFMILVVLIQGGNQGGIGAAFGGGNSQGVFGASGATSLLGKLTYAAALVFMCTSVSLAIIQGKGGNVGLSERLKNAQSSQPLKVEPAAEKAGNTEAAPEVQKAAGSDAAAVPSSAAEQAAPTTKAVEETPAVPSSEEEAKKAD